VSRTIAVVAMDGRASSPSPLDLAAVQAFPARPKLSEEAFLGQERRKHLERGVGDA
jgi:hypothetical protein